MSGGPGGLSQLDWGAGGGLSQLDWGGLLDLWIFGFLEFSKHLDFLIFGFFGFFDFWICGSLDFWTFGTLRSQGRVWGSFPVLSAHILVILGGPWFLGPIVPKEEFRVRSRPSQHTSL